MFNKTEFASVFEKIVTDYSLVFGTKITDLTLETLIYKALQRCKLSPVWDSGGHGPGMDISFLNDEYRLSVKSAKETANRLTISSFRTTTYDTLQEKLDYFDGSGKNFNYYFVLSRIEKKACKSRPIGNRKYIARMIPADLVVAGNKQWYETNSGWACEKTDGVTMRIQKKMSDQFWFDIDKDIIDNSPDVINLFEIDMGYDELGSRDFTVV